MSSPAADFVLEGNAMKECDGCGQTTDRERAWLIEGDGCYFDGHFVDSRGFTRKVDEALRFSRRMDAEAVRHWLLQFAAFALRTTEHIWINGLHRE